MVNILFYESGNSRIVSFFFASAAGLALTCSFPGVGLDACAWFALMFLFFALRDAGCKRAFLLGVTAGMVHYLTLLYWIVPTLHKYGPLSLAASIAALFLLAFYLSLYMALFSVVIVRWLRTPAFLPVMAPAAWVCLEFFRTHFFSGFPWGLLGYSQFRHLALIQMADIFGVWGISFLLIMANSVFFLVISHLSGRQWQGMRIGRKTLFCWISVLGIVIVSVLVYGSHEIKRTDRIAESSSKIRVAVVQGNIGQAIKWDHAYEKITTEKYITLSDRVSRNRPELVVWPETAVPFYFFYDTILTNRILETVRRAGCFFLVGAPTYTYGRDNRQVKIFNSALLIDPKGQVSGEYNKVHLVPFGEYVPLRKWLPFVGKIVSQLEDFSPGKAETILRMGNTGIATQICYEIIFPGLCASMVRVGADIIVNITNDAWFGQTSAPMQHFSMAVFRAVENRRAVVRGANTGISGFIGPSGRILETSGLFKTDVLFREVPVMLGHRTFYTMHGDILPLLCMIILLMATLWCARRKHVAEKMGLPKA
ncbi:MAG: apolipoprotein N-acyltransferase [Deltaproteobacteria bacterium]|nr:apolipoprotein N-acyltransferase [Deltaproteobacteria bacterium]